MLLHQQFVRNAKHYSKKLAIKDKTTKSEVSYGRALIGSLILSKKFEKYDKNSLISDLGATVAVQKGMFTPQLSLGWLHEFKTANDQMDYRLASGENLSTDVRSPESNRFKVGVGTGIDFGNDINLSVNYDKSFSQDYNADTFSLTASVKF